MEATIQVSFYNNDEKSKLHELNQLLNPYGITFISDQKEVKNGKVQRQWHINVDEETLQQYSRLESKKAGRLCHRYWPRSRRTWWTTGRNGDS